VKGDVALRAIEQSVTFFPCQSGREVFHYYRVGIESGEWGAIRFPPVP
jgi:hypothetical protein